MTNSRVTNLAYVCNICSNHIGPTFQERFLPNFTSKSDEENCGLSDVPNETLQVLASCHSLAYVDTNLVGDPLEIACLSAIDWTLTKGRE